MSDFAQLVFAQKGKIFFETTFFQFFKRYELCELRGVAGSDALALRMDLRFCSFESLAVAHTPAHTCPL